MPSATCGSRSLNQKRACGEIGAHEEKRDRFGIVGRSQATGALFFGHEFRDFLEHAVAAAIEAFGFARHLLDAGRGRFVQRKGGEFRIADPVVIARLEERDQLFQ